MVVPHTAINIRHAVPSITVMLACQSCVLSVCRSVSHAINLVWHASHIPPTVRLYSEEPVMLSADQVGIRSQSCRDDMRLRSGTRWNLLRPTRVTLRLAPSPTSYSGDFGFSCRSNWRLFLVVRSSFVQARTGGELAEIVLELGL